jgi:hypothetical protein
MQPEAPVFGWYVPAAHATQRLAPEIVKKPAAHEEQRNDPGSDWKVPPGQLEHRPAP